MHRFSPDFAAFLTPLMLASVFGALFLNVYLR
jgi:hypothetical protein